MTPAVEVQKAWKYFGDYPALRSISLDVPAGTCLALLGRNGAGKTTLLRILSGLSNPSEGSVRILGHGSRDYQARARTGMIGHGIGIYDELSAAENLRLFARLFHVRDAEQTVQQWLTRVSLDRVQNSVVREFSRGMRQRLALARAFLHGPSLLLLDEPFTSLDDRAIALLQSLLADALKGGATVIMSTHQLREAMELATHVALLDRGKLAHSGERPVQMLADPTWLYRTYGDSQ
ncbi:MAG: heme ABC exporter ATP-binding protein CcmA [Acidobacteria bacterium]|nr:heme ABC exporter ATP-binding protein CcmA [Acidobacteriota bacterium]